MDSNEITHLNDDELRRLILRHVHYTVGDPAVWTALREPENVVRTREALRSIVNGLGTRMTRMRADRDAYHAECFARGGEGKREWFTSKEAYENERGRLGSLHKALQSRLAEVREAQKDVNRQNSIDVSQQAREALRQLSIAVQKHQAAHARSGTIAEQCDYELWQLLNRLTVPVGPQNEQLSLRAMLDFYWTDVEAVSGRQAALEELEGAVRSVPVGGAASFGGSSRAQRVGSDRRLVGEG